MLDDAELFSQLCQKHSLLAEPDIIEAVKLSCSTGELRLAHTSIIAGLCGVIAQVLSSSSTIKLVDLSDCMLLSKGLNCIFKALCEGSNVNTLYLKGNNISGPLVEQLGEMLKINNTLKIMNIEWNSLGSQIDSFAKFCEGLAKNHNLEEMDLKYNQISTLCADSLATAIKHNKSLKKLDLSWNSLGLSGGQKILQGVQQNRILINLNLKGNCVPSEIYSAIKERIQENQRRDMLYEKPVLNSRIELQTILSSSEEDEDSMQVIPAKLSRRKNRNSEKSKVFLKNLRDSPRLQDSENDSLSDGKKSAAALKNSNNESDRNENIELTKKIESLQQQLEEKNTSLESLKTESSTRLEELERLKSLNDELNQEVERIKEEKETLILEKSREVEGLKKAQAKAEESWKESYRELEEAQREASKLRQEAETKSRSYEREVRKATLELQSLKAKHASGVQSYEDRISEQKLEAHRLKRELQEREGRYRIESNALKESLKESSEALEKCQEQLQKLRDDLRESAEAQARLRLRADESERLASRGLKLEEALHRCAEERDRLEERLQAERRTQAQLQKQIVKLHEEALEPQKKQEALRDELQLEREALLALKSELREERARTSEQSSQVQKLITQLNEMYARLTDAQTSHAETIRVKDAEIERLKSLLDQKASQLDEFKSDQVQRAQQFQAAVSKYLGTFGSH